MLRRTGSLLLAAVAIVAACGAGVYLEMPLATVREIREDGDLRTAQYDYCGQLHGTETHHFASGVLHRRTEYQHGVRVLGLEYWPSGRLMTRWQEGTDYTQAVESFPDSP